MSRYFFPTEEGTVSFGFDHRLGYFYDFTPQGEVGWSVSKCSLVDGLNGREMAEWVEGHGPPVSIENRVEWEVLKELAELDLPF